MKHLITYVVTFRSIKLTGSLLLLLFSRASQLHRLCRHSRFRSLWKRNNRVQPSPQRGRRLCGKMQERHWWHRPLRGRWLDMSDRRRRLRRRVRCLFTSVCVYSIVLFTGSFKHFLRWFICKATALRENGFLNGLFQPHFLNSATQKPKSRFFFWLYFKIKQFLASLLASVLTRGSEFTVFCNHNRPFMKIWWLSCKKLWGERQKREGRKISTFWVRNCFRVSESLHLQW